MDTDNSYVQNLLLAAENVEAFKKAIEHDIHKIVNAVKKVFPVDGKTPELATVIQFLKHGSRRSISIAVCSLRSGRKATVYRLFSALKAAPTLAVAIRLTVTLITNTLSILWM
ncbi:Exodeoxyribonuclease VIII [Salmonella enterica subsp. enterica]|uniref:Exodeoxyribonuclease VIII n=1 Tax=Salmonella enterica I TaxID=59201 RepID=A0A379W7Z3_SALET|nr:Exodeoxyribonuclease VIII [Salmonella enterica subsp. enterica]